MVGALTVRVTDNRLATVGVGVGAPFKDGCESSWAGDRYLVKCGGLRAGVGSPLLLKKAKSLIMDRLLWSAMSTECSESTGSSKVRKPGSSGVEINVAHGGWRDCRLEWSSEVCVLAGDGMDWIGIVVTTQDFELILPMESSMGRLRRFPTTLPTRDSL